MQRVFVAYYRVSTDKQGRSGLGLEAQRAAVHRHLGEAPDCLVAEFTEVETGKGANALDKRPQLKAALDCARRRKATLLIAKLDRLARNVHFISGLIEQRVPIVAADMPDADITMLQIYAVMAEREGRMIGERTKAALAAAKARGVTLGANGKVLAQARKAEAWSRLEPLAGQLAQMKASGQSLRAIAAELNASGVSSPGGGKWHLANLHRALKRLEAA